MSETSQKVCTACKTPKDATTAFFAADKRNKSGLQAACRLCDNKRRRVDAKLLAPNREAFADEAAFQQAMAWYHLLLDKAAAELVLNNPDTKFTKRENARKSLEQTLERMKKLRPGAFNTDGSFAAAPVVEAPATSTSKRQFVETNPFKTHYREGSAEWKVAHTEWQNLCRFLNGAPASTPAPVVEQPKVESPKAVIEIRETLPAFVPPPQHDLIFVLEDDFMFYPDGMEAKPPLPLGVRFVRAPLPPGYSPGDRKISPHYRYDRMTCSWWRI